ncbi:hypothetical protein [Lentibacillus juripiscarius]|uniref:DUF4025 domain-containing protein n=1 Tax=Lentibacillus juripiscarius TaxID=257446 RepID=A0ABW5V4X2_9BACI
MAKKKEHNEEKVNTKLGGMGLYGTTSNEEIAGYKTSGDIENAGKPDKGFHEPKENDDTAPTSSIKEGNQEDY